MNRLASSVLMAGILVGGFSLPAMAQQFEGRCELHYRDQIIGEGPCTATQSNDANQTVTVKGTISENGENYLAIINNRSNYGTLIGAGTFTLAEGKLVSNSATRVIFGNHYELDIFLSDEEVIKGAAQQLIQELFK
jgi:hypothetical protein